MDMNRRQFLSFSAAALLAPQPHGDAARPNILFILADDLGYGDLGCYGQTRIATPNVDRLAAEGMRFTQAYSGATVCAPSRCSLMTGLHCGHATVRGNKKPELGIRPTEITVASLHKQAGYETALFGKWGLGGPGTGSVPNTRGFDHFFGYLDQQHAHNYYPEHLWDNQNEYFLTGNWFDQRKAYAPDLFTRRTLDFLQKPRQKPFFLYLTYTIPHANNELGSLKGNGMEVPDASAYADRDWPAVERNFAAMISRMDGDIGKIVELLKQTAQDQNTIVFFSSDNGPHREGGHNPDYFQSRGPLRGIKRDLYEGGIRVPFIVRYPGKVAASSVSDEVVAFWDFLPTAAELAGVQPPLGQPAGAQAPIPLDGVSYLPALFGQRRQGHAPLYWEFHEGRFAQAIRLGDWKGVRLNPGEPVELYNLKDDIAEKENTALKHPDIVRKMESLMASSRIDTADFPIKKSRASEQAPF
jgi:arylsulfatase A-like enzyme